MRLFCKLISTCVAAVTSGEKVQGRFTGMLKLEFDAAFSNLIPGWYVGVDPSCMDKGPHYRRGSLEHSLIIF